MRSRIAILFSSVALLAACQTKGEKKAPCPPIAGFVQFDDACGAFHPVNERFAPLLKG